MTSLRHREIDERPLSDAVGPVIDTDLITIERTELDESWSIAHVHADRAAVGPHGLAPLRGHKPVAVATRPARTTGSARSGTNKHRVGAAAQPWSTLTITPEGEMSTAGTGVDGTRSHARGVDSRCVGGEPTHPMMSPSPATTRWRVR